MMMRPKWLIFFLMKSFSWTMLSNSRNIIMEWVSGGGGGGGRPAGGGGPIVVNNIIYLLCTKLGCLENK